MPKLVVSFTAKLNEFDARIAKSHFEANPDDGAALIELIESVEPYDIEITKIRSDA